MEFARKHMHLNLMQWKNVIWSYESISTVSVYNNDYDYRRGFIGREALIRPHLFPQLRQFGRSHIRYLDQTWSYFAQGRCQEISKHLRDVINGK